MRYLYYCNSAYQILTILNLHWHRKYASFEKIEDYDADLIVMNSFDDARRITEILKQEHYFCHVFLVDKSFNSGRFHSLHTLIDLLVPSEYLDDKYGLKRKDMHKAYDVITAPKYNTLISAVWRLNPKAKLHLYEDGTAAYFGALDLTPDSRLYKKFFTILNYGRSFYDYERFYLNDASLFSGDHKEKTVSIPDFDPDFLMKIKKDFKEYLNGDDAKGKDILYFAQYLNNKDINIFIDSLLSDLEEYKENVLYIPHPRHKDSKTYGFDYVNKKQIWELKQLDINDLEEKMLIAIHSTACFTPKILFDREPYLLLFYKLCDDKVTARNDRFDIFVERFIRTYRDPGKIMIPETPDELKGYVKRFIEGKERK
ncbi:MAG: alpha-2,8-polysialyltransferase family protein [Erysipelotrichaceae bacterium]|nr:alpha-2,8-polysialyltransferase family protein [Erysipelotrichaceae bacterium]